MKRSLGCHILRKYKLTPWNLSDREISWRKNILGYGNITWANFVKLCAFGHYLNDTLPAQGIFIKELNIRFGGTMTINLTRNEEEREL